MSIERKINRLWQLKTIYLEEIKYWIKSRSTDVIIESQKNVARILVRMVSTKIIWILSKEYYEWLNPKKILFIESSSKTDWFWFWDGIFKIPAIEALANHFSAEIDLICLENRKEIFEWNPNINEIITTKWNSSIAQVSSIIEKLFFKKYDLVVSLSHGTKIWIIKLLTWIRTPYINEDIREQEDNINHTKRNILALSKHIPDINKYLDNIPKLYISEEIKQYSKEKLKHINGTKVAIFIWAINWLKDFKKWDEIINSLNENNHWLEFILLWASKDKNQADVLSSKFSNIHNFVWETSLKQVYWLIDEMDLCIGSDWNLTNAAVALWKKLVAIFSIIEPDIIIWNQVKNVEKITWNCPVMTRCFKDNVGKKCLVTWQTNRNFSDTPPCLENIDNKEIIINAEKFITNKKHIK